jgi:hypothetical protein
MVPQLRRWILCLGIAAGLALSFDATADEVEAVPQPIDVDLKRLATELDFFTAEARRARVAEALTGLGIGSIIVPSGLILLHRTDGISQALVIGLLIGGSAQVVTAPFGFLPTRMDEIRDDLKDRRWKEPDSKDTVRAVEDEWRDAAAASRKRRKIVGTTMLAIGTASLATGLTFLLTSSNVLGMNRSTQYTLGGVLTGSGIQLTSQAVRFLFEWTAEETSWESYRNMKADAPALRAALSSTSVSVSPTRGGAVTFASLSF